MASQTWSVGQVPHACTFPQPSGMWPQRPSQATVVQATHWLFSHFVPKAQVLAHANPFPQASVTRPHPLSPPQASDCATQVLDVGLQIWPCTHEPHWRMCPQLSLTSPHVRSRLAQVAGTQMATGTVVPPPSMAMLPASPEETPVVPPVCVLLVEAAPPIPYADVAASPGLDSVLPRPVRLSSSVAPPWPGLLPEAPPLDVGLSSVFGAIEPRLQEPRRNSQVKTTRVL